jgi:hypothetical protein
VTGLAAAKASAAFALTCKVSELRYILFRTEPERTNQVWAQLMMALKPKSILLRLASSSATVARFIFLATPADYASQLVAVPWLSFLSLFIGTIIVSVYASS